MKTLILTALASPRLFACLSMVLSAAGALRYGIAGMWGQCLYWILACLLTATVTFLL